MRHASRVIPTLCCLAFLLPQVALAAPKAAPAPAPSPQAKTSPEPPHAHRRHLGMHLQGAFVALAAKSLGTNPRSLSQQVFLKGFPAAVKARGTTVDKLIGKMADQIVVRANARGQTVDRAKAVQRLTKIYNHLSGQGGEAAKPLG